MENPQQRENDEPNGPATIVEGNKEARGEDSSDAHATRGARAQRGKPAHKRESEER